MSQTQTVIVYRSMTAQRVDEFVNSGDFFPIFIFGLVFVLLFALIQNYFVEVYCRRKLNNTAPTIVNAIVSAVFAAAFVKWVL